MVLVAAALGALVAQLATLPAAPVRVGARATVLVRIVIAAEVRNGRTEQPHQRRNGRAPDGSALPLIEFE